MSSRLPSVLYIATWACLIGLPLVLLWLVLSGQVGLASARMAFPGLEISEDLPGMLVLLSFAIGLLPWIAVAVALWHAQALFGLCRMDRALTLDAAKRLQSIGAALCAAAVLRSLSHTGQVLLLTLVNPAGERVLAISVGFSDFGFLLAAGLMTVIGRNMVDAAQAVEDVKGFV